MKEENPDTNSRESGGSKLAEPIKSYRTILRQEVEQAVEELERPAAGLFISGLLAGLGVSVSIFLIAILWTAAGEGLPMPVVSLVTANLYAVGFILVIMGRTDLFTEYTTIAILPVLAGRSRISRLVRMWSLVYFSNLVGSTIFASLIVVLGPGLKVADGWTFETIAREATEHPWWIILLSATLAGWLMGLLSWLVTASRDTIGQILFIWLIAGAIGLGHLHHCVTGTTEVMVGLLSSRGVLLTDYGHFLFWTTLGNVFGGVFFAVLIRYSVVLGTGAAGQRSK
jgi:formate-nitrite transporter family protein